MFLNCNRTWPRSLTLRFWIRFIQPHLSDTCPSKVSELWHWSTNSETWDPQLLVWTGTISRCGLSYSSPGLLSRIFNLSCESCANYPRVFWRKKGDYRYVLPFAVHDTEWHHNVYSYSIICVKKSLYCYQTIHEALTFRSTN